MAAPYLIIVPTYNEADNLRPFVERLESLPFHNKADLLVVDDASPDGTGKLADELARERPWLHVLHRSSKEGIGPAYLAGFRWGLSRGYAWLIQMDADFSHDMAHLQDIDEAVSVGFFDVLIGSRYISGGGVRQWNFFRRMISRLGNRYASLILSCSVKDLTGGFNTWSAHALNSLALDRVLSNGYAFQVEMKYRAIRKGLRVLEFPIVFVERFKGRSKMSQSIVSEALMRILQLRWRAIRGWL